MQRDDDDDGIESAARRLERGNKTSPDEAKKQLRQQIKKQEHVQNLTKLQLQMAKLNESKPDAAKTKTHAEMDKEEKEGAQKKLSVEDQVQQESQQKAAEKASPFEYQQDAG